MPATWKLPRFALVQVDLGDGPAGEAAVEDLLEEIVRDELLVGGMETKAWRELGFVVVEVAAVVLH